MDHEHESPFDKLTALSGSTELAEVKSKGKHGFSNLE